MVQREYVQFRTGSHRWTWDQGWEESGEGSVYQYFLDPWVGPSGWETESIPLFSGHPAVPFGIGEDRTFTRVIVAPIRSTRAFPFQRLRPGENLAGPTPGRRHPPMRCRIEEVEEVLSHADCS